LVEKLENGRLLTVLIYRDIQEEEEEENDEEEEKEDD
jgi:hypothetical protein